MENQRWTRTTGYPVRYMFSPKSPQKQLAHFEPNVQIKYTEGEANFAQNLTALDTEYL